MANNFPLSIYLFLLLELVFVSYGDLKSKKIPNFWSLLHLVCFVILLFFAPGLYIFHWATFLYSVAFFVVGFALFSLNIMGGGDSKFLATFFLLIPLAYQHQAFLLLLGSTIVVGGSLFLTHLITYRQQIIYCLRTKDVKNLKNYFGSKFSYAPVILLSWVLLGVEVYIGPIGELLKIN